MRKYIKVTSDNLSTSTTTGTIDEDTASAIVALAERIEYLNSHAVHIPDTDSEAEEEVINLNLIAQLQMASKS